MAWPMGPPLSWRKGDPHGALLPLMCGSSHSPALRERHQERAGRHPDPGWASGADVAGVEKPSSRAAAASRLTGLYASFSCLLHPLINPRPCHTPFPGGNGYINEYPTGRLLRDAKLYEIGAGTSEIRRFLIGRDLVKQAGEGTLQM